MQTIACYHTKGGVGKTTTAVNLAHRAALAGNRTLLWDLDPLGTATAFLDEAREDKIRTRRLVAGKRTLKSERVKTAYEHLHLIPSHVSLRTMTAALFEAADPTRSIKRLLAPLSRSYAYVFLDLPAGYSPLADAVLRSVDVLLVPVVPTTAAMDAFSLVKRHIKKKAHRRLLVVPFFSMVDRRKRLHRDIVSLHANGTQGFLHATIPQSSTVEQMGVHRAPLLSYDRRSVAARGYTALWNELTTIMAQHERMLQLVP